MTAPARVANLAGLPPTFVGVGEIDLFAEENIVYVQRLMAAGVSTELLVMLGAYHGFDGIVPEAASSKLFTRGWNDALSRAFKI